MFRLSLTLAIFNLSLHAIGSDFPKPANTEPTASGSPMPAAQAASTTQVPEGFEVDVVATEPIVQNPIAMTWDRFGRLWVAENYTYAERGVRFDLSLKDRVLIFEDRDKDGIPEHRSTFIEDVQYLTSVEVGLGGVWLMCPPHVLFVPDADEDGVPDGPPQVVLDGFTVADSNYHNFANGLRFGPDGWLYGRCGHSCPASLGIPGTADAERIPMKGGIWRYHPTRKIVEVLTQGTVNPWGHDWDQHGELFFINTVIGHLWQMIEGAHFLEPSGSSPNPFIFERMDGIADHRHYDTVGGWSSSRDGKANNLGGGHAHIGMMIYQADQWPASYRNKLFTINMHGRRTNVERLERLGSGYIGKHEPDVFIMEDPFFRGLELSTGPDGSAFMLDWSDAGECHEFTGVHRESGRIYRLRYGQPEKADFTDLETLDPAAVDRLLRHPNVWFERQCRLRIANGVVKPGVVDFLHQLLASEDETEVIRLRALWALEGANWPELGGTGRSKTLVQLLSSRGDYLRVWAIRLLMNDRPRDGIDGKRRGSESPFSAETLHRLVALAQTEPSSMVRLALASAMQRVPFDHRVGLAQALANHSEDASDPNLPSLLWMGLAPMVENHSADLVEVAKVCKWPHTLRWLARALMGRIETHPEPVNALFNVAVSASPEVRLHLLQGVSDGVAGWRRAPKPQSWDQLVALGDKGEIAKIVGDLSATFGDGVALDKLRQLALDEKADVILRTEALKSLIEARVEDLRDICEKLLSVRGLNITAVRGLAGFDDPKLGQMIAAKYRSFYPAERPAVVDMLVSRAIWADSLLDQIAKGVVPREDLTAFHVRQIQSLKQEDLNKKLALVWGELRESPQEKLDLMAALRKSLTPDAVAKADLSQGRLMFMAACASCHVMYGEGGKLGPDLTGSGRANLDYLLENIVDPSATVSADYKVTLLTLKDGRKLSGVVTGENQRTVTLQMLTEKTTVEKEEITEREISPMSMMPEGLLTVISKEQVRNLIAYLMHPRQVPLPGTE